MEGWQVVLLVVAAVSPILSILFFICYFNLYAHKFLEPHLKQILDAAKARRKIHVRALRQEPMQHPTVTELLKAERNGKTHMPDGDRLKQIQDELNGSY